MVANARLALLLAGCAAWQATELGRSPQSGWTAPQVLVIRDSTAFAAAWTQLYPIASLRPASPTIDFAKTRVLIVASGTKPTGGYRLALSDAAVVHDSAIVGVTLFSPPSGCAVSESLTYPAVAIAIPASPVPFRIVSHERADTVRCN